MIFDTHAHYDDEAFDQDREELISSLPAAGIRAVVNVGASLESTRKTLALSHCYSIFYAALGVHPNECADLKEEDMDWLKLQAKDPKAVAIGEIGLDYHWDEPGETVQKKWFSRQLELAAQLKLPVVIHSRDAAKDTLDVMKGERAEEIGGVIHCFSYGKEMAREYLNMGFYLGIGGVATFQNGKKLKEVIQYAPMDRLVLETDCPYLAPVPYRGKRNSSLNLPLVIDAVSQIKNLEKEKVEQIAWENSLRLYGLQTKDILQGSSLEME